MIISILEPLPTHIVTSPSTSFCLFCNSCFELLIFSSRTSIKYSGVTINTSKVHINNMYIKYTLVHFAILLIHQIFRAFPASSDHFLCSIITQFQALVQLWASLREWQLACHSFLKFSFFPLPFYLKLMVLSTINTWCFFLISTFADFTITKSLGIVFRHPLHIIVHHEVLVTRELCQSLSYLED